MERLEKIVRGNRPLLARDLCSIFNGMWARADNNRCDIPCYRTAIKARLANFGDKLSSVTTYKRLRLIIFPSHMTYVKVIWIAKKSKSNDGQAAIMLDEATQLLNYC